MKMCTMFVSVMLLSVCSINASEKVILSAAQQYPFNATDKILFYNTSTEKVESPYSTLSVEVFSKDEFVVIEKNAYDKLLIHALQRSNKAVNTIDELYSKQEDKSELQRMVCKIRLEATHNNEQLKAVRSAEVTIYTVRLSQRNLMQILQWLNGIKRTWNTMTGSGNDYSINLLLGTSNFTAQLRLKAFLIKIYNHEQGKSSEWLCDSVKN